MTVSSIPLIRSEPKPYMVPQLPAFEVTLYDVKAIGSIFDSRYPDIPGNARMAEQQFHRYENLQSETRARILQDSYSWLRNRTIFGEGTKNRQEIHVNALAQDIQSIGMSEDATYNLLTMLHAEKLLLLRYSNLQNLESRPFVRSKAWKFDRANTAQRKIRVTF